MRKHIKKVLILALLAITVTGCKADEVKPVDADKKVNVEVTENESNANVMNEFEKLISNETEIQELKKFIDENISNTDKESADKMVYYLIELLNKDIEKETDYFYNESNMNVQIEISKAYEKDSSKFDKSYAFAGKNKYILVDSIEDKEVAEKIKQFFDKGYGLSSAEGTYYPVADYKVMKENYIDNVTEMTAEYLDILTNELDKSTTVEEYLSISISELKDRALRYEEFLRAYPNAPGIEDIRRGYMVCVWKLVCPNPFDGMLDEEFKISSELNQAYESILADDSHPVTNEAVKGITEFIKSKNGVLGSYENMDDIYNTADSLHKKAAENIEEFYLKK